MRSDADAERVRAFVREFARRTSVPARVYLVGGTSAVIEGWRATTLDIDVRIEPDDDAMLRDLPRLKPFAGSTQDGADVAAMVKQASSIPLDSWGSTSGRRTTCSASPPWIRARCGAPAR